MSGTKQGTLERVGGPVGPPTALLLQQQEEKSAEELFGMQVVQTGNTNDPVRIVAYGANEHAVQNAVVYHQDPVSINLALKRMRTSRLLSRSVSITRKEMKAALAGSRQASNQHSHDMFVREMESYALPNNGLGDTRREVIYWGSNTRGRPIIPVKSEQTASLGGTIPSVLEFGPMLWSVMRMEPMRLEGELMMPLAYAAPFSPNGDKEGGVKVLFDTIIYDGYAYRFWVLKGKNPASDDGHTMKEVFKLPVDLLWCNEVTVPLPDVSHWWASLVARGRSEIVRFEEPVPPPKGILGKLFGWFFKKRTRIRLEFPEFAPVEEQLDGLVRRTTVTGPGIMKAFRAYLPGSNEQLQVGFGWHLVTNPIPMIEEHNELMGSFGDPNGTVPIGKLDGTDKIFGLDDNKFWPWVYTGETNSGKTTLAIAHAKSITPWIFVYLLTAGTDEGAPVWVMEEGGTTFYIDARVDGEPDVPEWAKTFGEKLRMFNKPDPETEEELLKLIRQDELEAEAIAVAMYERVLAEGPENVLPVCVQVAYESNRAYRFALSLAEKFEHRLQRPWYRRARKKTVKIFDGIGSLPKPAWHERFHNTPKAIGDAFRQYIGLLIRDCRKYGIHVFCTSLTEEELEGPQSYFEAGFFRLFTVHIPLRLGTRVAKTIENPKQRKVLGRDINVTLPTRVVAYIGQRIQKA